MESRVVSYGNVLHLKWEVKYYLHCHHMRQELYLSLSEFQAPVESGAVGVFPNPQSLWPILFGLLSRKTAYLVEIKPGTLTF